MHNRNSWLLPEGIEEILPAQASYLENLRNSILGLFKCWGYELVIPPMIDFIESLLTGSGYDLDLQTFKLTDQMSGKTLGFRADMTPQVARMDAHQLRREWPTRLCYAGTVLHTRADPLEKNRSPMQIGAELYGHPGIESDVEVIRLMLEMLSLSGILHVHLDLGHVGIFRALSRQAGLRLAEERALFELLQRKARPELEEFVNALDSSADSKAMLIRLPDLNGGSDILITAQSVLSKADETVKCALASLETIAENLSVRFPSLPVSFDLAELRGYHYHTGVVFAAFVPVVGKEIARGGRYDNIGAIFGRARPATGFSADLKVLAQLGKQLNQEQPEERIFAPDSDDAGLLESIRDLRAHGRIVIQQLPAQQGSAQDMNCTAELIRDHNNWAVKPLTRQEQNG